MYWDRELSSVTGATEEYKKRELRIKNYELRERERYLRKGKGKIDVLGKTAILTDDGVATGATMRAAIRAVRKMKPTKLILAVPVIAFETVEKINQEVDELIFLGAPVDFQAVGQFYRIFSQVSDEEVQMLLKSATKIPKEGIL